MFRSQRMACLCTLGLFTGIAFARAESAPVKFTAEIAPILAQKCSACHGAEKRKGGYQLHHFAALMQPGDSKTVPVVPGQPAQSRLFQLIATNNAEDRMPQKDDPLAPAQIALIERWIAEGARFDGTNELAPLASLAPAPAHPAPPARYARPLPVTALAFTPDGSELAVSGYHEVTIWSGAEGRLLRRLTNIAERTDALAYDPTGRWLAVAGGAPGRFGEVRLVSPNDAAPARLLASTADVVFCAVFSPDGAQLAAGGADNLIRLFDVATGRLQRAIEQHADWILALAWSPDGQALVSASRDKTARVFTAATGELEATYLSHGAAVTAVAWITDEWICTAGRDQRVHVWQAKEAKDLEKIIGFDTDLNRLLAVGGERLFSVGADGAVREHRIRAKKSDLVRLLGRHADAAYALAFHAPTHRLATGGFDGEVRIWDAKTGEQLAVFGASPGFISP